MLIRNPYADLRVFITRHSLLASLKLFAHEDCTEEIKELVDLCGVMLMLPGVRQ